MSNRRRIGSVDGDDEDRLSPPSEGLCMRIFFPCKLIFCWMTPILMYGLCKTIEMKDLPRLPEKYKVETHGDRLTRAWNWFKGCRVCRKYRLLFSVLYCFGLQYLWAACLQCVSSICLIFIPLVTKQFLTQFNPLLTSSTEKRMELYRTILPKDLAPPQNDELTGYRTNNADAWIYLGIVVFLYLLSNISVNLAFFQTLNCGMVVRGSITDQIFKKSLKMSNRARGKYTNGSILNHVTSDGYKIWRFYFLFLYGVFGWIQIFGSFVALAFVVGYGALSSGFVALLTIPYTMIMIRIMYWLRVNVSKRSDKRLGFTNEILQGIRIIKYFTWEEPYLGVVKKIRKSESRMIEILYHSFSFIYSIMSSITVLMSIAAFLTYYLVNDHIDHVTIFTALTFFQFMRLPLAVCPQTFTTLNQFLISLTRIQTLLEAEEVDEGGPEVEWVEKKDGAVLEISEGNFMWEEPPIEWKSISWGRRVCCCCCCIFNMVLDCCFCCGCNFCSSGAGKMDRKRELEEEFRRRIGGGGEEKLQKNEETEDEEKESKFYPKHSKALDIVNGDSVHESMTSEEDDVEEIKEEEKEKKEEKKRKGILQNINLRIQKGSLVMICGEIGSGKSSLLSVLLGNMKKVSGFMYQEENSKLAYCTQNSWIQNATLRENITFGKDFDEKRFAQVVDCCQLQQDIDRFRGGREIQIGERGITLSGGQKARISLARACYSDASIVLLDDPLSAVDVDVAGGLMKKCVTGYLKDRTVVLVTHQVQFLGAADYILVMKDGRVVEEGTYQELYEERGCMYNMVSKSETEDDFSYENTKQTQNIGSEEEDGAVGYTKVDIMNEDDSTEEEEESEEIEIFSFKKAEIEDEDDEARQLIQKEDRVRGCIDPKTLYSYLCSMGCFGIPIIFIVLFFTLFQVVVTGGDGWLAFWSAGTFSEEFGDTYGVSYYHNETLGIIQSYSPTTNFTCPRHMICESIEVSITWKQGWNNDDEIRSGLSNIESLLIYGMFGFIALFLGLLRSMTVNFFALRSSSKIHTEALKRIMNAPVSFFDSTPIGRIVRRFSEDLYILDNDLIFAIRITAALLFMIVGSVILIIVGTSGLGLIIIIPLFIFYFIAYMLYRKANIELRRLENISKSPLMDFFGESLNGISTIRAYESEARFVEEMRRRIDFNNRAVFLVCGSQRWLGANYTILGTFMVFLVCSICVILVYEYPDVISVEFSALAVSLTITVSTRFFKAIEQLTMMEGNLNSAERLEHYRRNVEQEAPKRIPGDPSVKEWPKEGEITFDNFSVSYASDPENEILKNFSLTIPGGSKVGVVGRTGSGKSTMILSLLRILEARSGRIVIDGKDISGLGLFALRSRISMIPQDPLLFSGTIRTNLDPFRQYKDQEILDSLERAGMLSRIVEKNKGTLDDEEVEDENSEIVAAEGLHSVVFESGGNYSVGESQLLCLARSILKGSKILLLDEATANVDMKTDRQIQRTIRNQFKDCTVITIAHRLNTIIDSEKILVIDDGNVVEFDSPKNLVMKEDGVFKSMIMGMSKKSTRDYLMDIALGKRQIDFGTSTEESVSDEEKTSTLKGEEEIELEEFPVIVVDEDKEEIEGESVDSEEEEDVIVEESGPPPLTPTQIEKKMKKTLESSIFDEILEEQMKQKMSENEKKASERKVMFGDKLREEELKKEILASTPKKSEEEMKKEEEEREENVLKLYDSLRFLVDNVEVKVIPDSSTSSSSFVENLDETTTSSSSSSEEEEEDGEDLDYFPMKEKRKFSAREWCRMKQERIELELSALMSPDFMDLVNNKITKMKKFSSDKETEEIVISLTSKDLLLTKTRKEMEEYILRMEEGRILSETYLDNIQDLEDEKNEKKEEIESSTDDEKIQKLEEEIENKNEEILKWKEKLKEYDLLEEKVVELRKTEERMELDIYEFYRKLERSSIKEKPIIRRGHIEYLICDQKRLRRSESEDFSLLLRIKPIRKLSKLEEHFVSSIPSVQNTLSRLFYSENCYLSRDLLRLFRVVSLHKEKENGKLKRIKILYPPRTEEDEEENDYRMNDWKCEKVLKFLNELGRFMNEDNINSEDEKKYEEEPTNLSLSMMKDIGVMFDSHTSFRSFLEKYYEDRSRVMRILKLIDQSVMTYILRMYLDVNKLFGSSMKEDRGKWWISIDRIHLPCDTYVLSHRRVEKVCDKRYRELFQLKWELEFVFESLEVQRLRLVRARIVEIHWTTEKDEDFEKRIREYFGNPIWVNPELS